MINVAKTSTHWNYFLALEDDLAEVSRYVEFCHANLKVYSIELTRLLLSAASEVDVLAKCVCALLDSNAKLKDINDYQRVLLRAVGQKKIPDICAMVVKLHRYGLDFAPWENWAKSKNPDWWRSYNNVKHVRDKYFDEATLQNALNAMGALLILNYLQTALEFDLKHPRKSLLPPTAIYKSLLIWPCLMSIQQ